MRPLTAARLEERGRTSYRLLAAGASLDRPAALDRAVGRGRFTDWPGRAPETAEPRWWTAIRATDGDAGDR